MAKKDAINPPHYKLYPIEAIDMMIKIWGAEKARDYCLMTAFKYRMRLGHKDAIDQELKKEKWYLDKAQELSNQTWAEAENKVFAKTPDSLPEWLAVSTNDTQIIFRVIENCLNRIIIIHKEYVDSGKEIMLKDESGTGSQNNITVVPGDGVKFEGDLKSIIISQDYGCVRLRPHEGELLQF